MAHETMAQRKARIRQERKSLGSGNTNDTLNDNFSQSWGDWATDGDSTDNADNADNANSVANVVKWSERLKK